MKTPILLTTLLVTTAAAATAHAEIGVQAQILPAIDGEISDDSDAVSLDFDSAFAIAGQLGGRVSSNFSIEFAPRLALDMKVEDATGDAWTQLDLAVRFTGHVPLDAGKKNELFGYLAPGYSLIFLPESEDSRVSMDDPHGFVVGIGAGAAFAVSDTVALVGDVGYSWGFQETTVHFEGESADLDLKTDILHVGFGIKAAL